MAPITPQVALNPRVTNTEYRVERLISSTVPRKTVDGTSYRYELFPRLMPARAASWVHLAEHICLVAIEVRLVARLGKDL
jgi:hypothetical protein